MDTLRVGYLYDEYNRMSGITQSINNISNKTEFIYGKNTKDNIIDSIKLNGNEQVKYSYDKLLRLNNKKITGANNYTTEYTYLAGAEDSSTTTMVNSIKNGEDTISYEYDELGNISKIFKNNELYATYTYDALNQLISETTNSETTTYVYDIGGNIVSKTTGETTTNWSYNDSNWKDKLTAFNSQPITYDTIGNPLKYRDGMNFTWDTGRRLQTINKEGLQENFTYNDSGIRTSKTINGVKTEFILDGSNIIAETKGNNTQNYFYDESNNLYAIKYNSSMYYYIRNAQNDIISIVDSTGTKVVELNK